MKRPGDSSQDWVKRTFDRLKLDQDQDAKKRYIKVFREMATELKIDFNQLLASKPPLEACAFLFDKYWQEFGEKKSLAKLAERLE